VEEVAAVWLTAVSKLVVVVAAVVVVEAGVQVVEFEVLRNKIKTEQKKGSNLRHLYLFQSYQETFSIP
jgi:hypothetical protein